MKTLLKEQEKFKTICEQIKHTIEVVSKKLEDVPRVYKNNNDLLFNMSKIYTLKLISLKKNINRPFFARIDFTSENKKTEKCYISKVGMMDAENNLITVDWRAPIASLYYDGNIGEVSYDAPNGSINGLLSLKRQFVIEDGKLISYADVNTVANDEILLPYLNDSADNRLKNIVSTIQHEQNFIIRRSIFENLIIQGVAGSGKTTVALHRIAYLVYTYIDTIKPNQYLVIGPNKFFVNYISGVLPDLDVDGVKQFTFTEMLLSIIDEKIKIKDYEISKESESIKTSISYKEKIDNYINSYLKNILPTEDLYINEYKILSKNEVKEVYNKIQNRDLNEKFSKFIIDINRYVQNKRKIIYLNMLSDFNNKTKDMNSFQKEEERIIIEKINKEIGKKNFSALKNYISKFFPKPLQIYKDFIINENCFNENDKNSILKNLNKRSLSETDLIALSYIKTKFYKVNEYNLIKHVVVDEAQDYGEFMYYMLKKLCSNSTFSIFGDIAQSIYGYKAINSWETLNINVFNESCNLLYLLKSYRTTIEIMNEANKITSLLGLKNAIPVIRHGNAVERIKTNDKKEYIVNKINKFRKSNFETIAVICKTEEEAHEIFKYVMKFVHDVKLINSTDMNYEGGICILTSALSKGLEFDCVIVIENETRDSIDLKLQYVAMTRALHELVVLE